MALHFRNHTIMMAFWAILALIITGLVGKFFGLHYLLLTPEYQGKVNFWSFFITGTGFGIFYMIWNLTSYLLSAHRFAFLATLQAPFTKFCLNNSIVPLVFLIMYLSATIWFQWHDELFSSSDIVLNVIGFMSGAILLVGLLATYFYLTNKDIVSFTRQGKGDPRPGSRLLVPGSRLPSLADIRSGKTRWRVDTYLTERLHLRWVRSVAHYNPEMLGRVFRQNHTNAAVVEIAVLALLMIQGLFMDTQWVRIPTGATIFILASIFMALYGAIAFWFRGWGTLVFLTMMVLVNFITGMGFFNYRNRAYGLNYAPEYRSEYNYKSLAALCAPDKQAADRAATVKILEHWLARNRTPANPKPKMVFICVSGGGMRSSLWTIQTLQEADAATGGKLLRQASLITGASGGILGAAYVREIYLRQQNGEALSVYDPLLLEDMGADLLNPVSFGIVSNDLFFPLSTFRSGNFTYRKDRGYLLEGQLNANCRGLLSKRLADYREPEAQARIPMMVITPFIINDARRLLISPQGVSYLMQPPDAVGRPLQLEIDGVDFGSLCAPQEADSLAFTSALRMNCTYPLVLPNVWLPTTPAIEVVDSGFRDNYGVSAMARFIHVFCHWIQKNTGGVVIVQIRCWERVHKEENSNSKGIVENILTPAAVVGQLTNMQDFEHDNTLSLLSDVLGDHRLEIVRFIYQPVRKNREASLSFHLSKREKNDLLQAFEQPDNQASLKALQEVLK